MNMNDPRMAQLTVDVAWDIVNRVDDDWNPARGAIHRINWSGPNPRFEFTATGLMLKVDRHTFAPYELLTPWGVWRVTNDLYFTREAVATMLSDYGAEEVPEEDRAYWNSHWGSCSWQSRLYSIHRFGDVELPAATGTAGLGTGHAARSPLVLQTYPEDYKSYWDMVRLWRELHPQLERNLDYYRRLGLREYRASCA